jgi:hypothetical protein
VKLEELARASNGLDEARFVARFSHPALVFVTATAPVEEPAKVDTPSGGTKIPPATAFERTSTYKTTDQVPVASELSDATPMRDTLAASPVVFLQKSARNPFESMITIGRASNNDHCLPLPTISKVHAYFSKTPRGEWCLTDQRATNGTFVDGQKLTAGATVPLADGSRIAFGPDVRARFYSAAGLFGFLALYRSGIAV